MKNLSTFTIRHLTLSSGKASIRPMLTKERKAKRMAFVQKCEYWTLQQWKRVGFWREHLRLQSLCQGDRNSNGLGHFQRRKRCRWTVFLIEHNHAVRKLEAFHVALPSPSLAWWWLNARRSPMSWRRTPQRLSLEKQNFRCEAARKLAGPESDREQAGA